MCPINRLSKPRKHIRILGYYRIRGKRGRFESRHLFQIPTMVSKAGIPDKTYHTVNEKAGTPIISQRDRVCRKGIQTPKRQFTYLVATAARHGNDALHTLSYMLERSKGVDVGFGRKCRKQLGASGCGEEITCSLRP